VVAEGAPAEEEPAVEAVPEVAEAESQPEEAEAAEGESENEA